MDSTTLTTGVLSAYDELLLAAVSSGSFQPVDLIAQLQQARFDWKKALRLAQFNRVGGFVSVFLQEEPFASLIDEDAREPWRLLQFVLGARAEAALNQTREVCQLLQRVGVRPLLYKGVDFERRYYPGSCPRAFGDIDIIVAPEDAALAVVALRAAGYQSPRMTLPFRYYRCFHIHIVQTHPRHRLPVEVHWALDWPSMNAPGSIHLILENAESAEDLGPDALRPNPTDTLILMACHARKHLGLSAWLPGREARLKSVIDQGGLAWLADVLLWMRAMTDRQSESIVLARARQLRAEHAIVATLRLVMDLDQRILPDWACEVADGFPRRQPLVTRLVYPDLTRGKAPNVTTRRVRTWLNRPLPGLAFRPIRFLAWLEPRIRIARKIAP